MTGRHHKAQDRHRRAMRWRDLKPHLLRAMYVQGISVPKLGTLSGVAPGTIRVLMGDSGRSPSDATMDALEKACGLRPEA